MSSFRNLAFIAKSLLTFLVIASPSYADEAIFEFKLNHKSPAYIRWMKAKEVLIAKQGMPDCWKDTPRLSLSKSKPKASKKYLAYNH